MMTTQDKNKHRKREDDAENGLHRRQPDAENSFLSGIKQRLLSFIFKDIWNEESDNTMVGRNADHLPAFFAVYNKETTDIVAFYQNSAEDLYQLFEQFSSDHFTVSSSSPFMNFVIFFYAFNV
ncbi:unnamed protein product [Eruca vesicaria subsp. sativa]|uniref:Uncharacterized protein n=1 Tax=Eruca vesicaria subsp. sativa TaxID=29727 RepID=A0ABC8JGX3_ERUVS|nr:unnamed protein product [Eruca vesicaria subsp. sativa]